ncbi:MAG: MBL fold metallo-hydrolase [Saprospiraceae bacterium]
MHSSPIWRVKLYGVRGSTPVCDANYQQFGGNTTCIFVDRITDNRSDVVAIFDAGTGIRQLGKDLLAGLLPQTSSIFLAFTHFHWDHIQGLPFFAPAYDPNKKIALFSPQVHLADDDLKNIFATQMQAEYFPVQLESMGADLKFFTADHYKSHFDIDQDLQFTYRKHNHPGGAFSYRVDSGGRSVVISTDLEHGEQIDPAVVAFAKNADLLIHDAQYTAEELKTHRGWGHSSYEQAIECARQANVKQLVFTHHDPEHDDAFLLEKERELQEIYPNCIMAREGMELLI